MPISIASALPDLGGFRHLRFLAEAFWDAQKQRQAQENRFRHAPASKGVITEDGKFLHNAESALDRQREIEAIYEKSMLGCFRHVAPEIAVWARNTRGVGEHTVARLLGLVGHPAIAEPIRWQVGKAPEDHVCDGHCGKTRDGKEKHLVADPIYLRRVAQFWSYCKVGDPSRKHRAGMSQEDALLCGSARARTIVYLLALAQEKSPHKKPGAYRLLYDEAKAGFAERHPDATKKHCQNHALRIVGKEILKDIWVVARKSLRLPTTAAATQEETA